MLVGSVKSSEDHGYVLDLGLPGVSAFLSKAEAKKYLESTDNGMLYPLDVLLTAL